MTRSPALTRNPRTEATLPELTRRYVVMAMASEAPFDHRDPDGAFVLKPWKDPAALRALVTYRENCYPELGRDLDAWIQAIAAGPVVRGDVGQRNEPHVKRASSSAGARGRASGSGARGRGRPAGARSRGKAKPSPAKRRVTAKKRRR